MITLFSARLRLAAIVPLAALVLVACTQDPNTRKLKYVERGTKYYGEQKYNEAILELKNALQIDPNYPPALHALGRAYRAKFWYGDALRELQRAADLAPEDRTVHAELGQTYLDLEAWKDALSVGERLSAKAPGEAPGFYLVGAAMASTGRAQEALEPLAKALSLPNPREAYHKFYGYALAVVGRAADADAACRSTLTNDARYTD